MLFYHDLSHRAQILRFDANIMLVLHSNLYAFLPIILYEHFEINLKIILNVSFDLIEVLSYAVLLNDHT